MDHQRAIRWIARQEKALGAALFTSSIPEIGFARVSVHRASGRLNVRQAADVLRGMLASLGTGASLSSRRCERSGMAPHGAAPPDARRMRICSPWPVDTICSCPPWMKEFLVPACCPSEGLRRGAHEIADSVEG